MFSILVPFLLMVSRVVEWQIHYRIAATTPLDAWIFVGSVGLTPPGRALDLQRPEGFLNCYFLVSLVA